MEQTLNKKQIWSIIRKRIILIVSLGVLFSVVSWSVAAFLITPTYEASRQILVNNNNKGQVIDYNTVMSNFQYANTYSDIILSDVVLEQVIKELGLKTTNKELTKKISVASKNESQVITITVKNTNYKLAVKIVNKIATVFEKQAKKIVKVDNIQLFPPTVAKSEPEQIHPKPAIFVVIGLLTGLVLGLSISFLLEVFSNTISSENDIEELLNIPVIGAVSKVRTKDIKVESKTPKVPLRYTFNKNVGGGQFDR